MTDFHALDRFAHALTMAIKKEGEGNAISGASLNEKYGYVADMVADMNKKTLEENPGSVSVLFENLSIDTLVQGFSERWIGSMADWWKYQPLICEFERAVQFREGPETKEVNKRIGDFPVVLVTRSTGGFERDGKPLVSVLLRPKFPEWYVFSPPSADMSTAQRHQILEAIEASLDVTLESGRRIEADDIDGMYFFFFQDIVPEFTRAASKSDEARALMLALNGVYGLSQVPVSPDTVHNLPAVFKEYAMLLFQSSVDDEFLPSLSRSLAEARAEE